MIIIQWLSQVDLIKKGLQSQAERFLELTLNFQALFNAQLQLADMLPLATPPSSSVTELENKNIDGKSKSTFSPIQ